MSQLIYFESVRLVGAVEIEIILLKTKEFRGTPWPSKVLKGEDGNPYCPLIAPRKQAMKSHPALCCSSWSSRTFSSDRRIVKDRVIRYANGEILIAICTDSAFFVDVSFF